MPGNILSACIYLVKNAGHFRPCSTKEIVMKRWFIDLITREKVMQRGSHTTASNRQFWFGDTIKSTQSIRCYNIIVTAQATPWQLRLHCDTTKKSSETETHQPRRRWREISNGFCMSLSLPRGCLQASLHYFFQHTSNTRGPFVAQELWVEAKETTKIQKGKKKEKPCTCKMSISPFSFSLFDADFNVVLDSSTGSSLFGKDRGSVVLWKIFGNPRRELSVLRLPSVLVVIVGPYSRVYFRVEAITIYTKRQPSLASVYPSLSFPRVCQRRLYIPVLEDLSG